LATIRYRGRFLWAVAGVALTAAWLVSLARKDPPAPDLDIFLTSGFLLAAAWFAWRATIVYRATYSGVTISRGGMVVGDYAWTDLREWCHDWTTDENNSIISWLWLRFGDGRRWMLPESMSRNFRDLRNHLAIHFDAQRIASRTPWWARFWP
jgi:hypothetical protein